jgi:colanic acid biosynthesis glycosyl transferase WcaI
MSLSVPSDRCGNAGPLVFLSLVFHPDSSASSLMLTDLFRRLAASGMKITVLCAFPSKDSVERVGYLPRYDELDGIRIIRCGLRIDGKRSLAHRALAYASFLTHAGWQLLRRPRTTRILGGSDPPFLPIALLVLSRLGRFRYELLLHDIYPDILTGVGAMPASSPVVRLWRALNRQAFRRARRVTAIGRDMVRLLTDGYGVDRAKIDFLPLWGVAEIDSSEVTARSHLLQELGLDDRFVVQYAGNMGLLHDMDSIVLAADMLRDDPSIHFLLIGKGRRRAAAEDLAAHLELTNITWLDFIYRDRLRDGLLACDTSIVSLRPGLEGVAVPSKLFGILASGRSVLAQVPAESEVAYVVEEERCGLVIPPGDPEALADAIRRLAADADATRAMGERARAAYDAKYSIEHAANAYAAMWGEQTSVS